MTELQVLGEAEKDRVWQSTLTAAKFRYSDAAGWERYANIGGATVWRPIRAGVLTTSDVYARAGETFVEVP